MSDELAEHLNTLARDECYRIDEVLKESPLETTQRVYFVGKNGAETGPYVRKYFDGEAGLGAAYERIWQTQRTGKRFLHLPSVIECYSLGNKRAIVMEYVCGETLADVVYRLDPSVALAADLFPKLCDAVRELHVGFNPPIIHRDLKPSNVMVSRDNVTLIDFGIARSYDETAIEDTRHFGTRAYAPPEQFGFKQTDERSDVYALGMLLYFCLTEKTPDATARANNFANAGIPESIRQVIAHAAAFDPDQRFESVLELKHAFSDALALMMLQGEGAQPNNLPASFPAPVGKPVLAADLTSEVSPSEVLTSEVLAQNNHFSKAKPDVGKGLQSSKRGLWSHIPIPAGIVWDVILGLTALLFVVVAVSLTFVPDTSLDLGRAPLPVRAVSYFSVVVLFILPLMLLLADRRPLHRLLPALQKYSWWQETAFCIVVALVGFVLVGVAAQFVPK